MWMTDIVPYLVRVPHAHASNGAGYALPRCRTTSCWWWSSITFSSNALIVRLIFSSSLVMVSIQYTYNVASFSLTHRKDLMRRAWRRWTMKTQHA